MHNKLKKYNEHDLYCIYAVIYLYFPDFYKIENCDVLMTIIVMLKFTQSPRPSLLSGEQL